ncbi:SigE family RNA polymerase sigma factor [Dactylosporangium matsuzakiense]|uniref:DNA-directed RNA polymerase sigma-70 factor n=1 Tax=Dactylosporangium matsuzakiense TaxID=53360 RepID=A0A9W6KUX3_9ACTN|nr:SigE family RNA polymerase sigma factor [Dactylosporangium matsuzakiense]UWZ48185.1 SigE family RNA polymerase sigma factor [Dactylosporangium matsuzakiense]GLL08537.1 DNA-directed RNA polymerase sigma-70 factor [Dactylosporangium matsuzakiense]
MRPDSERDFAQYVANRKQALYRVAYHLLGDRDRADDAVQATLTVLYARWGRVHEIENLDGYVHTMVVRESLRDRRRWLAWVRLSPATPDVPVASADPEVEQRMLLRAALRKLPERQRTVLVLRFLCDLPVLEVAALLGLAEGTVKAHTNRGLEALRRQIGTNAEVAA